MVRRIGCVNALLGGFVLLSAFLLVIWPLSMLATGQRLLGDPSPMYRGVRFGNSTAVRVYVSDASSDSASFEKFRIDPGDSMVVTVGYPSSWNKVDERTRRAYQLCIRAETELGQTVFSSCTTWGELEDAGWRVDITVRGPTRPR